MDKGGFADLAEASSLVSLQFTVLKNWGFAFFFSFIFITRGRKALCGSKKNPKKLRWQSHSC